MIARLARLTAALLLATPLLAVDASAQSVSLSIHKETKHGSFGITLGAPFCAPATHWNACGPQKVWVPAHWQWCARQVWVGGTCRQEWVAPCYEDRNYAYGPGCGKTVKVCVRPGYWHEVRTPGHFETVRERAWVEGSWRIAG
jgi:hypothetical protein